MRENFPAALENLKEFEGFKSNDPNDAGGETIHGISRVFHPEMWDKDGNPPATGTWAIGDTFVNTAGDNVIGWKCTTGTPCTTWKSMTITLAP